MTFREFTGKNVEEAIRTAMAEFSSDLGDLDIEILAQGSRGVSCPQGLSISEAGSRRMGWRGTSC